MLELPEGFKQQICSVPGCGIDFVTRSKSRKYCCKHRQSTEKSRGTYWKKTE